MEKLNLTYFASDESEKDKTDELEGEDLETSVEDSEEEEEEGETGGSSLFGILKEEGIVQGSFSDLSTVEQKRYERAAGELGL